MSVVPQKVFMVVSEEYFGEGIRGVFSTRELAQQYVDSPDHGPKLSGLATEIVETTIDAPGPQQIIDAVNTDQ